MVTFDEIPVAEAGISQLPLTPHTANSTVSAAANAVDLEPTSVAGRVSTNRHGTIGTNADATPDDPAA